MKKNVISFLFVALFLTTSFAVNAQTSSIKDAKLTMSITELISQAQEFAGTASGVVMSTTQSYGTEYEGKLFFGKSSLRFLLEDQKLNVGLLGKNTLWIEGHEKIDGRWAYLDKSKVLPLLRKQISSWEHSLTAKEKKKETKEEKK